MRMLWKEFGQRCPSGCARLHFPSSERVLAMHQMRERMSLEPHREAAQVDAHITAIDQQNDRPVCARYGLSAEESWLLEKASANQMA